MEPGWRNATEPGGVIWRRTPQMRGEVGVTKSLENHRCFNWGGSFFASFLLADAMQSWHCFLCHAKK